jgi:hypothetical protein
VAGDYYDYATGSDIQPLPVSSGTAPGTAVFSQTLEQGPADVQLAGGLSPYGTMAQGGNVWEWEETDFDLLNDSSSNDRGYAGGSWLVSATTMSSLGHFVAPNNIPNGGTYWEGFRVASIAVPEPTAATLLTFGLLSCIATRRRKPASHNPV